jgi:hypothetical protein
MTTEEYIAKMRKNLNEILQNNKPLAAAVATTHAEQMQRIFTKGKDSTGGNIGAYNSTDPLYVNPNTAPRKFPKKGKTGKTKFKNGNDHKTGFFSSYKAFRASQGRQTSFVDLVLSGQLRSDVSNSLTRLNSNVWVTGTKNSANSEKAAGAEAKYGNIFNLNTDEKKEFKEVLKFELLKALS